MPAGVRYYRLAPGDGAFNPITIPGTNRTYSAAVGSYALVPEMDRETVDGAGWTILSGGYRGSDQGTTAQRPALTAVPPGFQYYDTTLSALVVALGPKTGWANVNTGAIV